MPQPRKVSVRAFAKLNLSLAVLYKRPDSYHELRTVFQTVSLADRLEIEFTQGRRIEIELACDTPISGVNLVTKAAQAVFRVGRITGTLRVKLEKRIPIGGGLGGGSSDAAAILLALPVLAGKTIPADRLHEIAASIGSDVPFFLMGGAAIGAGRGEELYPLPPLRAGSVLVAAPGIAVSTPEAYAALHCPAFSELTPGRLAIKMKGFQSLGRSLSEPGGWEDSSENSFEEAVFERHPALRKIHRALLRSGARPARMSGSGSALFGVFPSPGALDAACQSILSTNPGVLVSKVRFLPRDRYRRAWLSALAPYAAPLAWPPAAR